MHSYQFVKIKFGWKYLKSYSINVLSDSLSAYTYVLEVFFFQVVLYIHCNWWWRFLKLHQHIARVKLVSSEFHFHKPITVHIELYLFYRYIHFLLYIGQYWLRKTWWKLKPKKVLKSFICKLFIEYKFQFNDMYKRLF